jgi:hypothetical protein
MKIRIFSVSLKDGSFAMNLFRRSFFGRCPAKGKMKGGPFTNPSFFL